MLDDPLLCSVLIDCVGHWEKMDCCCLQRRGVPLLEYAEPAARVMTCTQPSYTWSCVCTPVCSPSNTQLSFPLWSCSNLAALEDLCSCLASVHLLGNLHLAQLLRLRATISSGGLCRPDARQTTAIFIQCYFNQWCPGSWTSCPQTRETWSTICRVVEKWRTDPIRGRTCAVS